MSGRKIIDGLRDALDFLDGDRTAGRVMRRRPDGTWSDVSTEWLADRRITSKPAKLRAVAGRAGTTEGDVSQISTSDEVGKRDTSPTPPREPGRHG